MKRKIVVFWICILLIFPIVASKKTCTNETIIENILNISQEKIIISDPPGWASGQFNGTWG